MVADDHDEEFPGNESKKKKKNESVKTKAPVKRGKGRPRGGCTNKAPTTATRNKSSGRGKEGGEEEEEMGRGDEGSDDGDNGESMSQGMQ